MVLAQQTWGDQLREGFQDFFAFIPNLIGFLAVLIIGYIIVKLIARGLESLLRRAGLDERLKQGQTGSYVSKLTASPSHLLARIAFWALMLGVIALAVPLLGIEAFTAFVGEIFAYLPNVLAALLIFLVAGAIASGVATLARRTMGDTPTGNVIATVAPILIMAIAGFMILDQLKIAEDIVIITYAALIGAVALGSALAFGLGGREVAGRMLEGAYQKGQEQREQVKRDLQKGRDRTQEEAERARSKAQEQAEGDTASRPSRTTAVGEPVATEPSTQEPSRRRPPGTPA